MLESGSSALREDDPVALQRYLLGFDWEGRNDAVEEMIVTGGLPLWREILRLVPQPATRATLLELGSPPFHTTLLVQKFRNVDIVPTAGVVDERRSLHQRLVNAPAGEQYTFDCACFDLEREPFPFPDASFEGVLFCEVIEHLRENPVFTLSEIHRVLVPGGMLIVSTPNAARSGNLLRLWFAANVFDQYHLGSPLRGSRHSREYTLRELTTLIGGCGFEIDRAVGRNLGQIQYTRRTRPLEPLFRMLTLLAPGVHADHLFLRAHKSGPFRWSFPREIFDEGHLRWYLDVRASDVVVGENDVPHTSGAWASPQVAAGMAVRRLDGEEVSVHLLADAPSQSIEAEFAPAAPARVRATVRSDDTDASALGAASGELTADAPGRLLVSLDRPLPAGARVRVAFAAEPAAFVHRVRLLPRP